MPEEECRDCSVHDGGKLVGGQGVVAGIHNFTALIAEPSYPQVPFAATRGGRRKCNSRAARRQSASAYTHRPDSTRVDRAPCDRTMGSNCPKTALWCAAIA